tara:strand:- start:34007 stop:34594 length:588 start_codon:yes stop_codon:yes gene_type:complete
MKKLVLGTRNAGKLREFKQLFEPVSIEILPIGDFTGEDVEETGLTFVENAIIKARYACDVSGMPALADDSGLVIDALNGAPGIYSARYAGEHHDSDANIAKILQELKDVSDDQRTARFHCCLVYMRHAKDPTPIICEAQCEGLVARELKGENGFGYDPMMYLPEFGCMSAELSPEQKNKISHRGKAMQMMLAKLL